jgi:hypothetical protein
VNENRETTDLSRGSSDKSELCSRKTAPPGALEDNRSYQDAARSIHFLVAAALQLLQWVLPQRSTFMDQLRLFGVSSTNRKVFRNAELEE